MIVKKHLYANETNHEKVSVTDTFFFVTVKQI